MTTHSGNGLDDFLVQVPAQADYANLRRISFFDIFSTDEDLERLAGCGSWLGCPKGTVLVRDEEVGHDFFVVVKGRVEVSKKGRVLCSVGPGELLGEMGAMLHEKRSADATVTEDALLFRVHIASLNELPMQIVFPLMVFIYRITARRLREADQQLSHL